MTVEQYEQKIAQLEADVDDLNDEVEGLEGTVLTLEGRVSTLENEKDTLEERVAELEDTLVRERTEHAAALRAVEALRLYLSWIDSPPPNMDKTQHERFRVSFRRDLDAALREVS